MPDFRTIAEQLFRLSLPLIGINLLSVLTLAVDTAMCGRLPNAEDALAGLAFGGQLTFLLLVAALGLVVGAVAVVSRAWGAQDASRISHVVVQATWLMVALGLALSVVGQFVARPLLESLGATGAPLQLALEYFRVLLLGTVFSFVMILHAALLRGVGDTATPFRVALACNTLNIVLNFGLIHGNLGFPALGVSGAALGTIISQAANATALLVVWKRGAVPGVRSHFTFRGWDRPLVGSLFHVGWPAALDLLILNASFLAVLGMLGRIDPIAVAAHGMGLRIQALAFVPGLAVSQAAAALVGQRLGAHDVAGAQNVVWASIGLCTLIMGGLALIIMLAAPAVVAVFGVPHETKLMEQTVLWVRMLGWAMPIFGVWAAFVGMLQGAGDTRTSLAINALASLVLQIPAAWLLGFAFGWGAFGVWLTFPLSFAVKVLFGAVVWRTGRWARVGSEA